MTSQLNMIFLEGCKRESAGALQQRRLKSQGQWLAVQRSHFHWICLSDKCKLWEILLFTQNVNCCYISVVMAAQLKTKSIVYSRFLSFQTVNFLTASFHSVMSAFILHFWAKYVFLIIGKTRELVEETQKVDLRIQKYEPQMLQTPVHSPVRISVCP